VGIFTFLNAEKLPVILSRTDISVLSGVVTSTGAWADTFKDKKLKTPLYKKIR